MGGGAYAGNDATFSDMVRTEIFRVCLVFQEKVDGACHLSVKVAYVETGRRDEEEAVVCCVV